MIRCSKHSCNQKCKKNPFFSQKKDSLEEETIDPSEKFVLIMSIACTAWNPDEKR